MADGKRPFLPSIERAPAAFFQLLEDRLGETDLRQRAPYIATTLETLLADKPGFPDCFSQPPTMIAEWASDRESGPEPS